MGNSASTELPRRSAHFPPHSTAVNRETRQSCKRSCTLYESIPRLSIGTFYTKRFFPFGTFNMEAAQNLSEIVFLPP